jgi:hypothetical protein
MRGRCRPEKRIYYDNDRAIAGIQYVKRIRKRIHQFTGTGLS